jgi:phosphatidylglycerophosphatase A
MESMTRKTELRPPGVRIHEGGTATPGAYRTGWAWVIGTFFGIGWLKPGPGTWASLAATLLWYAGLRGLHWTGSAATIITLAGAMVVTLIGIPASTLVERENVQTGGQTDPGFVVIDEVAGQWVALAIAPINPGHALLGFALFRLFDIVKPWPVRQLERLHGGTGIMLDDLGAGVYGLLVMLVVRIWW